MKRMVLVTPNASPSVLKNYLDADIIGLDEGINIANDAGARLTYAITDFKTVSLDFLLSFLPKSKIMKYSNEDNHEQPYAKIVDFLLTQGGEDIIVLDSLSGDLEHIQELLLLLKNSKAHVTLQDDINLISYYGEGSHVISKQGYSNFSIFGFPEANVSMEHVSKSIKNVDLFFDVSHALKNKIFERVAVLKVNKGGVLLVLNNNE